MERDLQWKSGGHKLNVSLVSGEAICLCLSDSISQGLSFHIPFHVLSTCKTDNGALVREEKGLLIFSLIPPALAQKDHTEHSVKTTSQNIAWVLSSSEILCFYVNIQNILTSSWFTKNKTFTQTMLLRLIKFESWKRIWQTIWVLCLALNGCGLTWSQIFFNS